MDPAGASHNLRSTQLREGIVLSLLRGAVLAGLAMLTFMAADCLATQQALKIVVPFQAGASSDAVARLVAEHLQQSLGRVADYLAEKATEGLDSLFSRFFGKKEH